MTNIKRYKKWYVRYLRFMQGKIYHMKIIKKEFRRTEKIVFSIFVSFVKNCHK